MKSLITTFTALVLFAACGTGALPETASANAPSKVTFEKKKIRVGKKTITVEIADSHERRQHGLMFRKSLPEDQGMLFVFEYEQPLGFWMKNTLIPLAIGYYDKDKKLIEVHEMVPALAGEASPRSYPSSRPGMYALEMNKGWFTRNKIEPGTTFDFVPTK